MLSEASAIELDRALFGTQADDGVTPGGLLHGVTPLAAATGTDRLGNMAADIETLIAALGAATRARLRRLFARPDKPRR